MALVRTVDLSLDYPVFDPADLSIRRVLVRLARLDRPRGRTARRLHGIDVEARDGDRIGLAGPNGSGKTSLLRVLAGIYPPSAGTVEVEGSRQAILGLGAGIQPDLSADENMRLLLRIDGQAPDPDTLDRIWAFTMLDDTFRHQPIKTFSSGMQMRVLFAIATTGTSDILFLDEWLSVADATFAAHAERRMASLVDGASILFIASHDRALLGRLCNRILVLDNGRIVSGND